MEANLREHYERQDTEALLILAKSDLTDEAQTVLRQVLNNKGVDQLTINSTVAVSEEHRKADLILENKLAPLHLRFIALAIDTLGTGLVLKLLVILLWIFPVSVVSVLAVAIWFIYFLIKDAIPGGSIGKRLLRLRVVDFETQKPCSVSKSFWRNLPALVPILGVIDWFAVLGNRRMRLGDMIAGTLVIRR